MGESVMLTHHKATSTKLKPRPRLLDRLGLRGFMTEVVHTLKPAPRLSSILIQLFRARLSVNPVDTEPNRRRRNSRAFTETEYLDLYLWRECSKSYPGRGHFRTPIWNHNSASSVYMLNDCTSVLE